MHFNNTIVGFVRNLLFSTGKNSQYPWQRLSPYIQTHRRSSISPMGLRGPVASSAVRVNGKLPEG